jgi:K+-sensing histidine kinase KdpD
MLFALLNNAIQFTPRGGTIKVHMTYHSLTREAKIVVDDTGVGIEKDLLVNKRMFRYRREKFGLHMVARLSKALSGTVGVSSPGPNLGSSFFFTVKCEKGKPSEKKEHNLKSIKGMPLVSTVSEHPYYEEESKMSNTKLSPRELLPVPVVAF